MTTIITIPSILTANTYFWNAGTNSYQRRSNEKKHVASVVEFFEALGFDVNSGTNTVKAVKGDIEVQFSYSESCKNVYKSLSVYRGDKKSNISIIKKIVEKLNAQ